eukprot:UN03563
MEYKGFLVSTDSYMNVQLASTEEYADGKFIGSVGELFIRCNNVMYIQKHPEEDAEEDAEGAEKEDKGDVKNE